MKDFLRKYIEGEHYLQNIPLKVNDFIKLAKKRGIFVDEKTLESLEKQELLIPFMRIKRPIGEEKRVRFKKDGKTYYRKKDQGLKKGEELLEEFTVKFYSSNGFSEHDNELLKSWLLEELLYDPSEVGYEDWETFIGEELGHEKQRTITFYSNFQIYWLEVLLKGLTLQIDLLQEQPIIKVTQSVQTGRHFTRGNYSIKTLEDMSDKLDKLSKDSNWKDLFNLKDKKAELVNQRMVFDKFLRFLLLTQSAYYPYARSGGKTIQIHGDDKKWKKQKRSIDINKILEFTDLTINDLLYWYKVFTEKATDILSGERSDWFQLWKNITWSKKDKLEGPVRLGIDYIQWAVMLKGVIEDYIDREIPDIDELTSYSHEDILKIELDRWNGRFNPRHYRNIRNFDMSSEDYKKLNDILNQIQNDEDKTEIEKSFTKYQELGFYIDWDKKGIYFDNNKTGSIDFWKNKYKRLYYLSNSFGIDYQPRMTVFVEGSTEEVVFPKVLNWYYAKPEELGIDFINIRGIDKWFGGILKDRDLNTRKYVAKAISNFNALITYNLTR
jgi:hypothetical protein